MTTATHSSRRHFLRGLGITMALPFFESLVPRAVAATAVGKAPVRMAFLYVPNGINMREWTPSVTGSDFELPFTLDPLRAHRNDFSVISGLAHDKGRNNGDGPGDHARAAGSWLTGAQPLKSEGSQIRLGVSADQLAANSLGKHTRFPSLEVGLEPGRQGGKCDSGYACAYSNNISWRSDSTPSGKEISPRLVFDRLFSTDAAKTGGKHRRSILDFVMEDAKTLGTKTSGADKQKLDEYLTAVREIELRVAAADRSVAAAKAAGIVDTYELPDSLPESFEEHSRLMLDMIALAFQTDTTRVATCMLANEGSNRSYHNIGVTRGHHEISHHQNNAENLRLIREINRFHVRQLSYLLSKLKAMPEGDGTVLDNSMILYGSSLADGDRHEHDNLPLLLAGRGGGAFLPGRHIRYGSETPMCNLLLTMLQTAGVSAPRLGDSTGLLRGLGA